MESVFIEGRHKFVFSCKWQAFKYDEDIQENFYFKIKTQGLKAVDFLAVSKNSCLLVEVKDIIANNKKSRIRLSPNYDDTRLKNIREKLSSCQNKSVIISSIRPYLADEIVKKVKDTLTGLIASYRYNDQKLSVYNKAFLFGNKPFFVIVFLERNETLNQPDVFKPIASSLKIAIEQKLSFLGNIKVNVVNTLTIPSELGVKVSVLNAENIE